MNMAQKRRAHFKVGASVVYDPDAQIPTSAMTRGSTYTITDYDPNTGGWPDGCCGSPFITVTDDRGNPFSCWASRFRIPPEEV